MKKIIIFAITCLFFITGVIAQQKWAPIGAEWYYEVPIGLPASTSCIKP